jgi:hypothetical protein
MCTEDAGCFGRDSEGSRAGAMRALKLVVIRHWPLSFGITSIQIFCEEHIGTLIRNSGTEEMEVLASL